MIRLIFSALKAGISVGSHSVSHRILPRLSDNDIQHELFHSRWLVTEKTGAGVTTIAYPNGDFDDRTARIAAHTGYKAGFTTRRGYVDKTSNAFVLPRLNIHNGNSGSAARFMATLLRLF